MLKEKTSVNLGVPYVELKDKKLYLCNNGVAFTFAEFDSGINLKEEFEKRSKGELLYDYVYAKNTGILRKKRQIQKVQERKDINKYETDENRNKVELKIERAEDTWIPNEVSDNRRAGNGTLIICAMLALTSAISMYISTLHTATYLYDYVDIFSAWLMSASVTAYNSTAFEVSILFHTKKRNLMAFVFMILWIFVTLFSMATTVSVFYDRYNFNETEITEDNKETDGYRLALDTLQKEESDLRSAIEFKKKDIEYRQEREWATTAVRKELTELENKLQDNLKEQKEIVKSTPDATKEEAEVVKKESLFHFLGRIWHLEGGILEFIMSTLSAIFVNLIAPLSVSAVSELRKKELTN